MRNPWLRWSQILGVCLLSGCVSTRCSDIAALRLACSQETAAGQPGKACDELLELELMAAFGDSWNQDLPSQYRIPGGGGGTGTPGGGTSTPAGR